jgi:hypothetical protein
MEYWAPPSNTPLLHPHFCFQSTDQKTVHRYWWCPRGKAYRLASRPHRHCYIDKPAPKAASETARRRYPFADVPNEDATKMAAQVFDRFGCIDVLINNAAVFSVVPMNAAGLKP